MISKMPSVKGYSLRSITGEESRRNLAVQYILEGLQTGALEPVIDRTFRFFARSEGTEATVRASVVYETSLGNIAIPVGDNANASIRGRRRTGKRSRIVPGRAA